MQEHTNDRFSQIFEIALVVLGVLSAAEYDFFKELWGSQYAFRLVTSPMVLIIVVWLAKEITKDQISLEKWLWLTEFSWALWLMTLSYYQLFWWIIQLPQTSFVLLGFTILTVGVICLDLLISKAYEFNYGTVIPDYYKNKRWKAKRLILTLVAIIVISSLFGTLPPPNG